MSAAISFRGVVGDGSGGLLSLLSLSVALGGRERQNPLTSRNRLPVALVALVAPLSTPTVGGPSMGRRVGGAVAGSVDGSVTPPCLTVRNRFRGRQESDRERQRATARACCRSLVCLSFKSFLNLIITLCNQYRGPNSHSVYQTPDTHTRVSDKSDKSDNNHTP